jgi:hypothetical protein
MNDQILVALSVTFGVDVLHLVNTGMMGIPFMLLKLLSFDQLLI